MKRNFFSVVALLAGIGVILYGIIGGGGKINMFIDIASLFIVLGGALAGLAIIYSLNDLKKIPKLFGIMIRESSVTLADLPAMFEEFGVIVKQGGLLKLEEPLKSIEDDFLRRGLQLAVDGMDAEYIRVALEAELEAIEERHGTNHAMIGKLSALAPAFGMLGTVCGLVIMLGDLGGDASELGAGMATALITTFYGSFFQNLFFDPLMENLKKKTAEELQYKQVVIEGVILVQAGENPRAIKDKLAAYLSATERATLFADAERGE